MDIKHIFYLKCCDIDTGAPIDNFGDMITPYIYEKVTGNKAICDIYGGGNRKHPKPVVFGAGSILDLAKSNSIIWGSGTISPNVRLERPLKILSVRGPFTRQEYIKRGIKCPNVYGDIGLIMPHFYQPKVEKQYRVGIIPHYVDMLYIKNDYKDCPSDINIIDVTQPIEKVIDEINKCEMTVSSSLHGIIVSHAYNIKCMWVQISRKIVGNLFKYRDYYCSIMGLKYKTIIPYKLNRFHDSKELETLIQSYINPSFPLRTDDILKLCPF